MKKNITVSACYAYHVENPYKTLRPMLDKYGALQFVSMERYLKECQEKGNIWTPTVFESLLPKICIALSVLMICFLIGISRL